MNRRRLYIALGVGLITLAVTIALRSIRSSALPVSTDARPSAAVSAESSKDANRILSLAAGSADDRGIKLVAVKRALIGEIVATTAVVQPDDREVAKIASPIVARVVKLIADPGQQVAPGQPLAILTSSEVGQAKADFLKAKSLLEIATENLNREELLLKQKITPMKDVLDARAAQATAMAQYRATRETLRQLIPNTDIDEIAWTDAHPLAECPLTSPIAGTLVERKLIIGDLVDRNVDVMTVMNLAHVWVLASIYEHDLPAVAVGQEVRVRVDALPDKTFVGRVEYISDVLDPQTRTAQARIVVPNEDRRLKPGMFAKVDIAGSASAIKKDVLSAPASAIYDLDGRKAAFVQLTPNTYQARMLTLGAQGNDEVEVVSGLTPGDLVVTAGGLVLKSLYLNSPEN
jgi:cobalt-zinc-cadmium efflux system membrane fusion protein